MDYLYSKEKTLSKTLREFLIKVIKNASAARNSPLAAARSDSSGSHNRCVCCFAPSVLRPNRPSGGFAYTEPLSEIVDFG